jgi:hypothetical protein
MPSFPFVMPQVMNTSPLAASGNSNPVSLIQKSANMAVTFHIKFTLGSLTNGVFTVQALNPDGATWGTVFAAGGSYASGTLASSTNLAITVLAPGVKQLRVAYTTTGTVIGSGAVIDATVQL